MTRASPLDRRSFLSLAGGAALAAGASGLAGPTWAAASRRTLRVGTRVIEVGGRAASVFGITDAAGRSGLTLDASEGFDLRLLNESGAPTIIHWHGLTPPFEHDGNTVSQAPIPPGGSQDYAFDLGRGGTNWMHSHLGLQEQQLMAAPLIVRDGAPDRQEVVMLLHDFAFTPPEEILASLAAGEATHVGSGAAAASMSMVRAPMAGMAMGGSEDSMAGMGMGGMGGMDMGAGEDGQGMAGMAMDGMPGGAPMGGGTGLDMDMDADMDLNDIAFDAYLANDRSLDDPEVVRVDPGAPVRLRIVNAASSTNFWIDLGTVVGTVVAVDGVPVLPIVGQRFELAMAQRLDIEITMPPGAAALPILAVREGDRARTGLVLAAPGAGIRRLDALAPRVAPPVLLGLERRLAAAEPPAARAPDRRIACDLTGAMAPYAWGIDGRRFEERDPLMVSAGERVEITMRNRTMMSHPMHLHGHHFQVVALGRARLPGAVRDTVLVPPMDSVTIAFDADNPGDWPLHCHNLYHMAAGMMTTVRYA